MVPLFFSSQKNPLQICTPARPSLPHRQAPHPRFQLSRSVHSRSRCHGHACRKAMFRPRQIPDCRQLFTLFAPDHGVKFIRCKPQKNFIRFFIFTATLFGSPALELYKKSYIPKINKLSERISSFLLHDRFDDN